MQISIENSERLPQASMHIQYATAILVTIQCCLALPTSGAEPEWTGTLGKLIQDGIEIGGTRVTARSPIADPSAGEEERSVQQHELAGSRGWNQFARKSTVAPIHLDLEYLKAEDGERVGLRVHFAFVVHASLETLRDDDVMSRMFATESAESQREGFQSRSLTPSSLSGVGVEPIEGKNYSRLKMVLLKKISLEGVIASQRQDSDDFFAIGWILDPRFSKAENLPPEWKNLWSKLERDDLGRSVVGAANPYAGAAGYLVVSRLVGLDQASLFEGEVLIHEPEQWFSGSNLLRSKVPLILQESARKLRRGLK